MAKTEPFINENGCHIWPHVNSWGYPAHMRHKVMYEKKYGPVPKGLQLHHRCNTRACINPDHMVPMTRSRNVAEQQARKRGQMGWERLRVSRMVFDMVTEQAQKSRG